MNTYIKKKNIGIRIGTDGDNDDHIRQFKQISKYIIEHPDTWLYVLMVNYLHQQTGKVFTIEELINNKNTGCMDLENQFFIGILNTVRHVSGLCKIHSR